MLAKYVPLLLEVLLVEESAERAFPLHPRYLILYKHHREALVVASKLLLFPIG